MAAWRNGNASDYDWVIRRLQVRPLRWSFLRPSNSVYFFNQCDIVSMEDQDYWPEVSRAG